MSGNKALSWSMSSDWEEGRLGEVLGGENRTGEEEEQRILLETGGVDAGRSSKMFDLFPHTMADMFRSTRLLSLRPILRFRPPPNCSCNFDLKLPEMIGFGPQRSTNWGYFLIFSGKKNEVTGVEVSEEPWRLMGISQSLRIPCSSFTAAQLPNWYHQPLI